jgi:hypothetical protein
MMDETLPSRISVQTGFWSALACAGAFIVFTFCFVALFAFYPIFTWSNLTDYAAHVDAQGSILPDLARLAMLLFGPFFVVLLHSIHEMAREEHKSLVRIGLSFGLGFATLTGAHYFVQISAVRLSLLNGDLTGLEQVVQANPYSAMSAVNMLGWTVFLGLSSLFVAPAFSGGRLATVIRYAFLANGVFCLLGGIGYVMDIVVLVFLAINFGMGGAVTLLTVALALFFWRMER